MRNPSQRLQKIQIYKTPQSDLPIDLFLDRNEGIWARAELLAQLAGENMAVVHDYPSATALQSEIAARFGLTSEQVLITAGADEAIDRVCRAYLQQDRKIILPVPTFEMVERYARLSEAQIEIVPWNFGKPYPTPEILSRLSPDVAVIAMISPNNPTGASATRKDLRILAEAAPNTILLLDHAYVEFAPQDLTQAALTFPNVVVLRTFSKAWGLAGLRVGFALGAKAIMENLRLAGGPYAVAGPSLWMAREWLRRGEGEVRAFVQCTRLERQGLETILRRKGQEVFTSAANFVFYRTSDAAFIQRAFAERGIAVRIFPDDEDLAGCIRMTCPGNPRDYERLLSAIVEIFPQG